MRSEEREERRCRDILNVLKNYRNTVEVEGPLVRGRELYSRVYVIRQAFMNNLPLCLFKINTVPPFLLIFISCLV